MLTLKEIEAKLDAELLAKLAEANPEDFENESRNLEDLEEYERLELLEYDVFKDENSEFEFVDSDNMGDGNKQWFVMRYKPTGQTVGYEGWYSSYEGCTYDGFTLKFMKVVRTMEIWGSGE